VRDVSAIAVGEASPWGQRPAEGFGCTVNRGDTSAVLGTRHAVAEAELRTTHKSAVRTGVKPTPRLWIPGMGPTDGPADTRPWAARYYDGVDLTRQPVLKRYEKEIGYFELAGSLHFIGVTDRGIRIYVDDDLVLDNRQPWSIGKSQAAPWCS